MLFKGDDTPVHLSTNINIFAGALYDPIGLAHLKWFNTKKVVNGECNILDLNDKHYRLSKMPWRKPDYDRTFQFPIESGFWLSPERGSATFSTHFDTAKMSDECCVWFPDEGVFVEYGDFMLDDNNSGFLRLSESLWVDKSIPKLTVYLWFEHFEGAFTMNLGTRQRMETARQKYSGLPAKKVDSI